jgi:hypothetical protein
LLRRCCQAAVTDENAVRQSQRDEHPAAHRAFIRKPGAKKIGGDGRDTEGLDAFVDRVEIVEGFQTLVLRLPGLVGWIFEMAVTSRRGQQSEKREVAFYVSAKTGGGNRDWSNIGVALAQKNGEPGFTIKFNTLRIDRNWNACYDEAIEE